MSILKWWQTGVFYQIYPRSFADGNGDGIGDFYGMIEKLDYLKDLGIDGIWISPHFPSPQFDCGYDVADYVDVNPEYGTLKDFKTFLEGCHARGIRVILDMVFNHTSHAHKWFQESRSSKDNPRRDWYIWRPGRNGGPPNNWYSSFGGSAWEYDPQTGEYYYHYFFKEQPDLNWRNPQVVKAMWEAVRFWLDMGVDGYRLDAIGTIFEDERLLDHPVPYTLIELGAMWQQAEAANDRKRSRAIGKMWEQMFVYQVEQPGMHELMQELRGVMDEYPERVLVGENDMLEYYGNGTNELHMVFNFPLMNTPRLSPALVRRNQRQRLAGLLAIHPAAWPCNTLGNHDSPRLKNRFGDGQHDKALNRLNLMLMLSLRGTPFLYNGEEIGMTDLMLTDIHQFKDLLGSWYYSAVQQAGMPIEQAFKMACQATRDKNRTPMQWSSAPNAGFCPSGVQPWLPVHPNYAEGVNVSEQQGNPNSMLAFYKNALAFRRRTPALISGDYQPVHAQARSYLAYLRRCPEQTCLVVLNYSHAAQTLDFSDIAGQDMRNRQFRLLFSSRENGRYTQVTPLALDKLKLAPFEARILQIS